ncbi:MAG: site-2 protease family protein [Planctomycetota bacterium]
MPFADPSPTPADLRFQLLGFPVRIHPFFWGLCVILSRYRAPAELLVWVVAVLVSILVHEFGHALLQRRFGGRPSIVLYGFGGLAIPNGPAVSPGRQILILLAGPGAGFVLAGLVWLIHSAIALPDSPALAQLLGDLWRINIFWGVFNLLPIYPLDGGQIAREVFTLVMPPRRGIVVSLWVSIIFCAVAGAALWLLTRSPWNLVLMGALAFNNYQTLEAYNQSSRGRW